MKNINTFGDLVKGFDGAQNLLGQRALPDNNSTPEQWDAFHAKLRPESADKYVMPTEIEGLPADYIKKASESKEFRALLHSASASPRQAQVLFSGLMKTLYAAEQRAIQNRDASFTKMATEFFGDKKDAIMANGKAYLAANLPENVKPLLANMDDDHIAVVLASIETTVKKFTGEDPFRGGGPGAGGSGSQTMESLKARMTAIIQDPVWSDPFKDRTKHAQLTQEMEKVRADMRKLQPGGG
jgi:negative regulator of replication initiation